MNPRPDREALALALTWAQKYIKRHDAEYGDHLRTLGDELAWLTARREFTLTALANLEAAHATVVPIETVRHLLTEGDR